MVPYYLLDALKTQQGAICDAHVNRSDPVHFQHDTLSMSRLYCPRFLYLIKCKKIKYAKINVQSQPYFLLQLLSVITASNQTPASIYQHYIGCSILEADAKGCEHKFTPQHPHHLSDVSSRATSGSAAVPRRPQREETSCQVKRFFSWHLLKKALILLRGCNVELLPETSTHTHTTYF